MNGRGGEGVGVDARTGCLCGRNGMGFARGFPGFFLGCFGFLVGFWFVVFCVCVVLKTPSFLLSPILQHEGIANQKKKLKQA